LKPLNEDYELVFHANISNKARNKVITSKEHLSSGANMFHWWGNERG